MYFSRQRGILAVPVRFGVMDISLHIITGIWLLIAQPQYRSVTGQRPPDTAGGQMEYCELEVFRPRCDADEVILITNAKYGMVKLGRCITTDYGYVGCYADVLDYLNSKCTGRRNCEQRQPDPVLSDAIKRSKCPIEFKALLYVEYKCVKDEKRSCRSCPVPGQAKLTNPSGYISSIVTIETEREGSCGSSRCPWVIVVQPGQVINITLLDYNYNNSLPRVRAGASSSGDGCVRYAVVKERAHPRDWPLCAGGRRDGRSYTSVSNVVEVHVVNQEVFSWKHQFLIRYEAIGCADIIPPKAATVTRIDDRLEIECSSGGDQWHLVCIGNSWQGHMGACSSDQPSVGAVGMLQKTASSLIALVPFGVLMAITVAILIIIAVLITTIGFVCYKKQKYKRRHRHSVVVPPSQIIDFRDDLPVSEAALIQKANVPTLIYKSGNGAIIAGEPIPGRENKYAANSRKMDARPLPSIPDLRCSGSWKVVAADPGSMAAIHRINSGRGSGQPRIMIRSCGPDGFRRSCGSPRPGSTCTVYSQTDPHQYFILEPEEPTGTGRDIREMILLQERQTIPRAHYHIRSGIDSDDGQDMGDGNIMITSIHEIPMRAPQDVSTGPIG